MNRQETEQVVARDKGWVPAAKRVKISPTNVRLETTVKKKEETFQVVIDVIKNSTCFKAFTIFADVPEILMQQFWHIITKVKGFNSYEFLLANKECVVNAEVFRKILDICLRKDCKDFTEVPNDDDTLIFLVGLGYSGPLQKYTNMFVDHMHQPWRTLAACINKCLSGKTASEAVQQYGLAIPATMLNIDIIESESYQRFLLYSTGLIPPKKSKGKGSQGKKTRDTTKETIEVTEESNPEPLIRKKTSRGRVTKKEATISAADNIIPDPNLALELGKSISLTKAEEEAAVREVHATHEKIVSEAVLEPTRRQTGVTIKDTSTVDFMKSLKESRKTNRRQSGIGGSDEGAGEIPWVPNEATIIFTTYGKGTSTKPGVLDEEEIIHKKGADETHADVEMKDAEIVKEKEELTDAEKTAELTKEITEQPLTSLILFVSFDYGTQFLNLSQDEKTSEKPPITSTTSELQQTTPIPTTIPTPPINTEASSILEITSLIVVQLRIAKLEQEVFELKKTNHSSQVPIVIDKYIGTKLNDALLKALESHTTDLIEKYSRLPALESSKMQESKKSAEEIIIIKREQDEKKQMVTYTIKSTDKAALKEFNLKSALFKAMHENNPANYRLYHALMEALIEDENVMDKDVADTVKDHKRKHDSDNDDDDDDDEGPPLDQTRVRHQRREEPESQKEPVEEPTKEVSMDEQPTKDIPSPDDMHVSDPEDTDNAYIPNVPTTTTWFRPLPEEERPASPELEWVIPSTYGITHWWFRRKEFYINSHRISSDPHIVRPHMQILSVISIKSYERYCYNYLNKIVLRRADYNEYKISEKDFKNLHPNDFEDLNILHLQSKLDHLPKQDKVHLYTAVNIWTRNIVIRKCVEDLQLGIESYQTKLNLEQPNWDASDFLFKEHYTIVYKPRAVIYKDRNERKKMMRINEVYKFSDGTLARIRDKLDFMVKYFNLFEYNKGMESRIWSEDDKRRSEEFIKVIEKRLKNRRIFRSLECFVGG
nr:hypothetical protein [Tanacetum cinerariifolium]